MSNAFSFAVPLEQNHTEISSSGAESKSLNNAASVGATVSATATARMKTYAMGTVNVPQQTRHARRIYVGGLPPNLIDEDGLRGYLNSVVAQGLGEENDHSYVLSVYINHKKCFAFIELKSIELATACLALDGIMLKNSALRILRANEYKPELVPASMNKVINFNLSGFQFGNPAVTGVGLQPSESDEGFSDRTFDSLIQTSNFLNMEPGTVVIVGYPYDENPKKTVVRGTGCAAVPKTLRNVIRRFKFGSVDNTEYDSDMSKLRILDAGDILGGKIVDECRSNLTVVVAELLKRGGIPVIIGGSNDLLYPSVKGASMVSKSPISVISLGSKVDCRLFDDFSQPIYSTESHFAGARAVHDYALFGAQGNILHAEEARNFVSKGGQLIWLKKDLRNPSQSVEGAFQKLLDEWSARCEQAVSSGTIVHIDCGSLDCNAAGYANSSSSTDGLKYDEVLQIAYLSGRSPTVSMLQITEFSPSADENRHNMLVLELLYYFCIGFNLRIEGSIENFRSPLGISHFIHEEFKSDGGSTDFDFASRLTSMVPPPSTVVPPFASVSESMAHSMKVISDESTNAGMTPPSSLSSPSVLQSSSGSNPSLRPYAGVGGGGGYPMPSLSSADADGTSSAMVPAMISQAVLQQQQQQQQQQQAMLNRLPTRPSPLESGSSPVGMRQQFLPTHTTTHGNGMNTRTSESNPSNGSNALGTSSGGPIAPSATGSSPYGRTLLDVKGASGQASFMMPNHVAPAPSESLFAGSSGGIAARNMANLMNAGGTGLRSASNGPSIVSNVPSSSSSSSAQNIHASLSRSTSSRSAASNASGNNLYVAASSSRSTGASFSGSSMASSAQPSFSYSGAHSMTQSPNGSAALLGSAGHLAHLPPHPPGSHHHLHQSSIQAPSHYLHHHHHHQSPNHHHHYHHHPMTRRGLYHQESHNQSSLDLGQDPHPFDEATDLNFDLPSGSSLKTTGGNATMIHNQGGGSNSDSSSNTTSILGNGSLSMGFKIPTGVVGSATSVTSPSSNYGGSGSDFLLNASTKSNMQGGGGGLGFSTSTDTIVNGSTFPHLVPYLSYGDVSDPLPPHHQLQHQHQQSQSSPSHQAPQPLGSLTNASFYGHASSNSLHTKAPGLLGFGK